MVLTGILINGSYNGENLFLSIQEKFYLHFNPNQQGQKKKLKKERFFTVAVVVAKKPCHCVSANFKWGKTFCK